MSSKGEQEVIVVCGLARCGTSLVMKMLHKGGIEPLCDPSSLEYGYELNASLELPRSHGWLNNAGGKAVKILDPQRFTPPHGHRYAFIFLTRDLKEQAKSHVKFINALGVRTMPDTRRKLEASLRRDEPIVRRLLASYEGSRTLSLEFEQLILDPLGSATRMDDFLQRGDFNLIGAASVVFKRTVKCLPYLLEAQTV